MTDAEIRSRLIERLGAVEERIAAACRRAGRQRADVTLVAVTKTVDARVARLLPELGVTDLGESRPQELWRKAAAMKDLPVRWHHVGHLQRNKVEDTLRVAYLVHAVDSLRLFEAIDAESRKRGAAASALLQINASRESQKHGFDFDEIIRAEPDLVRGRVDIKGLMTMAAFTDDPEQARGTFRELRAFRDRLRSEWNLNGFMIQHLSMGMSNDFEVAIEEGATLIRLGTVLFDGLPADRP
jgi:pyridoxal phosphate enzyme (YggS family)